MSLDAPTRERIESLLKDNRVVLFMKGSRFQPQCGFSAAVANTLNDLLRDYQTVNVLEDAKIREGIKEYGQWPTIPQLYVDGELIGGADIVRQLYTSGDLFSLLDVAAPDRTPPEITITDKAAAAIRQGTAGNPSLALHLEIGANYQANFQLAPAGEHDIIVHANGIELHFDPVSAQRAKGIVIDWVTTLQGEGLSLKFPGANDIKPLSVHELNQRLDAGTITLIDVRPPEDLSAAPALPQARILQQEGFEALSQLPKDQPLAFICHHGISSQGIAEQFAAHGFTEVYNVEDGMDAWAREIDSTMPRY